MLAGESASMYPNKFEGDVINVGATVTLKQQWKTAHHPFRSRAKRTEIDCFSKIN